ncbi:hypothetical protein PP301_gp121 [Gordonia phage GMA2]|uniref:Uncharacterized protein n=1 Tax=Gordonia phage GMA2 TaxID=1647283 RepID=A0A0K0N7G2_9CAUD|nr:hypothetical protein PP301_gp121 [Gordonia phage GMA2]AKJ72601.1 hypothetical protein GMA2_63 [Gordonia phage GMA2]
MIAMPIGVARGRIVELQTKRGNTVEGEFKREREELIYVKDEKGAMQVVSLDDIEVFVIAEKQDGTEDED